ARASPTGGPSTPGVGRQALGASPTDGGWPRATSGIFGGPTTDDAARDRDPHALHRLPDSTGRLHLRPRDRYHFHAEPRDPVGSALHARNPGRRRARAAAERSAGAARGAARDERST